MNARVRWAGEPLELRPERAAFWPGTDTLLIADTHFGKPATFRHAGMHVPEDVTEGDLARLDRALEATRSSRLIILGDFFHSRTGRAPETMQALARWRERRADLDILLVRGNHDHGAGDPPAEWRIRTVAEPYEAPPFLLRHEPAAEDDRFVLAGHVHPAVRLRDDDGTRLQVPCFLLGSRVAILPAFGGFTGTARVHPDRNDRVFAVGPDAVIEVETRSPSGS